MIKKQKEHDSKVVISTLLFNHEIKVFRDRVDIQEIDYLTEQEYSPAWTTALYDAIGKAIVHIENVHKHLPKEKRPDKVLFVTSTDGLENASSHYNKEEVKRLISVTKTEKKWDFLFLGANINVTEESNKIGIYPNRVACYKSNREEIKRHYILLNRVVMEFRTSNKISDNFNELIK